MGEWVRISGGHRAPMLSGFNTNFRYRGVLFHVQTEDSGQGKPHVITHLFHGGNIIASEKCDYAHLLGAEDVEQSVRKLMEGQHKAMLKGLSRGAHDVVIGERLGPDVLLAEPLDGSAGGSGRDARGETQEDITNESAADPVAPAEGVSSRTAPRSAAMGGRPDVPAADSSDSRLSRVFGDRVVSEKPLDEVVLDYLVENARKRKRSGR
jgi:hypothetical protein